MAAVRIDSIAFSDPRIALLGELAGYNQFEALGRLAHLWSACTERGSSVIPISFVRGALGPKGIEALVESGLGERKDDECRVRGCEGRIGWLESKRRASKAGGEANKRKIDSQREPEGSQRGARGEPEGSQREPEGSPLTLPLTLPLALPLSRESESAPQKSESIDRHEAAFVPLKFPERFRELAKRHPHKAPASRAEIEWKIVATSEESVAAIETAHAAWMACEQWQDGVGIPTLANFLRERWFDNVPEPAPAKQKRSSGGKESVAETVARLERKRLEQEGAKS